MSRTGINTVQVPHTEPLKAATLTALTLGELRPAGWLHRQLQLQADGMAGHLDEFWPDIADSAWIGGTGEGWERVPYWLDGLVPLSLLLGDSRLTEKATRWISHILAHQDSDGWMGPHQPDPSQFHATQYGPYDVWPRMPLLKALLQYQEGTEDDRVIPAALRLCRRIDDILRRWPLHEWGKVRWADLVYCLDRLFDLTGEAGLVEMADRVQAQGYDWLPFAQRLPYRDKVPQAMLDRFRADSGLWMNDHYLDSHGANVAMGLKAFPVWSRHAEDQGQQQDAFFSMLTQLDQFHGQATGAFTADEHLAGRHPSQGTETCTVVEYLFSLAVALEAWGTNEAVIDRWERIAFNALPASARPNEWGHQYDQQANQVVCHVTEDRIYTNNGPDSNIFGLAPHFGCCTANRHQGWPKFAARLWMRTTNGLAVLSYAPCRIDTHIRDSRVAIEVNGDYPFSDEIVIQVRASGDDSEFPIDLRIPAWAEGATVQIDGDERVAADPGTSMQVQRNWAGSHTLTVTLPALLKATQRFRGAVSISRGPVVFALAAEENWRQLRGTEPYADWEVHPGTAWNYSLELNPNNPNATLATVHTAGGGLSVFTPDGALISLIGRGGMQPAWQLEHGAAEAPPTSPCPIPGDPTNLVLLPYGAARLRVTEMPWHYPRPNEHE
jgi:hypothetical protein